MAASWIAHTCAKVGQTDSPGPSTSITLDGVRNAHESVQLVVNDTLTDVDVTISDLTGPGTIPSSAWTLYRVNYVDCEGDGWLPDSMVPFINPATDDRIGSQYGAPFDATAGQNIPIWLELLIPTGTPPGVYTGAASVTAGGIEQQSVPIQLTVHNVTLAATSVLKTYFNLKAVDEQEAYLFSLHDHRIDVWNLQNITAHSYNDTTGQMDWSQPYDDAIEAYFDGTMFPDGVPAKLYLFGYGTGNLQSYLKAGGAPRITILTEFENRYKNKPWVSKLAWFIYDEPANEEAEVIDVGMDVKQYSPSIGMLLTYHWNEPMSGLVDVWDPIINLEVVAYGYSPGPEPYRQEIAEGRSVINAITVNSNKDISPNLFIHRAGINQRIWTWATWMLGHHGIEFWETAPAPGVTEPQSFGSAWGDGSLFYKGLPAELGVPSEIPLPSIRLKMIRDGIEDYELLNMLKQVNAPEADRIGKTMAQDLTYYDDSYITPIKYIDDYWSDDGLSDYPNAPGYLVFEADLTRLETARTEIMTALAPVSTGVFSTHALSVNADGSQHTDYPTGDKPGLSLAPDSLSATNPTLSTIDLSWSYAGSSHTGFILEQKIEGAPWTTLPTLPPEARAYQAAGLPSDSHIGHRVRAESNGILSAWSQEAWADTLFAGF